MKIRKLFLTALILTFSFVLCSCGSSKTEKKEERMTYDIEDVSSDGDVKHTAVKFETDGMGEFTAEMYPEYAPQTVSAFLKLVSDGFYDGASFEKVFTGRYILSSEKGAASSKDGNLKIYGEFYKNGVSNSMPMEKGTLVMYHPEDDYNGGVSRFMIMLSDVKDMEGTYAPFAKITSGIEVAEKIASAALNDENELVSPIVMKKVSVVE